MNRFSTIICAVSALVILSCGQRQVAQTHTGGPLGPVGSGVLLDPADVALLAASKDREELAASEDTVELADTSHSRLFEALTDAGIFAGPGDKSPAPYRLCKAVLTSKQGIFSAFPDSVENFFPETTPEEAAFYFPAGDIRKKELVRTVQLRYNYAAFLHRFVNSYEWFERMSISLDEEKKITKKDTLEWIRFARPDVSRSLAEKVLPDEMAQKQALMLMDAYDRFDGDDSEDSPYTKATEQYVSAFSELPELVSDEELDSFEKMFWEWYDKKAVFEQIDSLVLMHMSDDRGERPSDGQLEGMRRTIEAERDIDRRTVLALEYVKYKPWDGVILLGEILESGIYTKYLLEAWISWRANVQMEHSPSSFSVIPNNYYDRLRVKCLDTMVRHCLEVEDKNAECLIENLLCCEIVHRMGSLFGNSSLATLTNLNYREFIHPRLLED